PWRDWLTSRQKEARRGRAELLLVDRAAVWTSRPENRQLPSLLQWFQIKWLTAKENWTPPQRKMMRKASRYHAVRVFVAVVLLSPLRRGAFEGPGTLRAPALLGRLAGAHTNAQASIPEGITSCP